MSQPLCHHRAAAFLGAALSGAALPSLVCGAEMKPARRTALWNLRGSCRCATMST